MIEFVGTTDRIRRNKHENPGPTWELFEMLMARAQSSHEWKRAGFWTLAELKRQLGDNWPARCFGREGRLPAEFVQGAVYTVAFGFLLEWALRFRSLERVPGLGKVRKELKKDVRAERRRHTALQLEIAALSVRRGFHVVLEGQADGQPRRHDVSLTRAGQQIATEALVVLLDEGAQEAAAYSDRVMAALERMEFEHGVQFDGALDAELSDEETEALLGDLEVAADVVASGGEPQEIVGPAAHVTVRPPGDHTPATFSCPPHVSAGWPRCEARLREKAIHAAATGATWIRADVLDGLWWASDWAQRSLHQKTVDMTALVRTGLRDYAHLSGVVLSSSLCPSWMGEYSLETVEFDGSVGMRRMLPLNRVRKLIIVPMWPAALPTLDVWTELYDSEPAWLDWALRQVDLPSVDAINPPARVSDHGHL